MSVPTIPASSSRHRRLASATVVAVVVTMWVGGCGELQPVEWTRASTTLETVDVDLSTTTIPGGGTFGEPRRARYTVEPGDTLGSIATRFGVTQQSLMAANNIEDPNRLEVGTELRIPGPDATVPPPWLQSDGSDWGGR